MSSLNNEAMGAFIDAVYAIAITILALEIPTQVEAALSSFGFLQSTQSRLRFCLRFGRSTGGSTPSTLCSPEACSGSMRW